MHLLHRAFPNHIIFTLSYIDRVSYFMQATEMYIFGGLLLNRYAPVIILQISLVILYPTRRSLDVLEKVTVSFPSL